MGAAFKPLADSTGGRLPQQRPYSRESIHIHPLHDLLLQWGLALPRDLVHAWIPVHEHPLRHTAGNSNNTF